MDIDRNHVAVLQSAEGAHAPTGIAVIPAVQPAGGGRSAPAWLEQYARVGTGPPPGSDAALCPRLRRDNAELPVQIRRQPPLRIDESRIQSDSRARHAHGAAAR